MPTLRRRMELMGKSMGTEIPISQVWSGAGAKGVGRNPYMNQAGNGPMSGKGSMKSGMGTMGKMKMGMGSSKNKMSY